MKEKIAIIDSLGAHGSSFHFYVFGQAKGLSKSGLDVSIYTNNVTNNPHYERVKFYQYYKNIFASNSKLISGFRYICGSLFSLFHARFSGVKICNYHLFHVNVLVLFDFLLTKMLMMKVVYTIHDVISFENANSSQKISNFIYNNADKILTHNNFSKEIFTKKYNKVLTEIDIVPHGNYLPFLNIKTDKLKSRARLRIPKDKKVLLFFGIIKQVKGLEVLLNALKDVISVNQDIILVIAGRVWKNDFSIYQKIIDDNNLSDYCIIHNRWILHEEVNDYYASADLVVLPYKRIYQSGVLLMSMSYERAVLVSDLPPLTEVVQDMKTGFVFESENPKSLSKKLNIIFADTNKLEEVRVNGFNYIKSKYNWLEIGKETKKSYQSIL
ncbi:MAG: hypothetical protein CMD22_03295 [Flavobacteriales bacterium]|nr:hypothetical protein [Flavobacteriales bacterium]|tara:strand:- start:13362 stop:14510 length:1149 start_codon:yes stop_codon:yes gene_type:complete